MHGIFRFSFSIQRYLSVCLHLENKLLRFIHQSVAGVAVICMESIVGI